VLLIQGIPIRLMLAHASLQTHKTWNASLLVVTRFVTPKRKMDRFSIFPADPKKGVLRHEETSASESSNIKNYRTPNYYCGWKNAIPQLISSLI